MTNSYNVLVVEDQTNIWDDLTDFFEPEIEDGILTLDFAATAKEGLRKISTGSNRTDVIIIDVILPDTPGNNELYFIDSLDTKLKEFKSKPKGILVSAHKSLNTLNGIASKKDWIVSTFIKPLNRKILKQAIEQTLHLSSKTQRFASISEEIDENLLIEIRSEANIIKSKMKRSVTDIIDAGKRLHAVKKKLPHGYFKKWIEIELGCHYTTGVNLMRVADIFGDSQEKVSNMGVAASILYFLATPSTPKQAREKVIQLIEDGENISYAETKKIVKEFRKSVDKDHPATKEANFQVRKQNDFEKNAEGALFGIHSSQQKELVQNKQQILKIIRQQPEINLIAESANETSQSRLRRPKGYRSAYETTEPSYEVCSTEVPSATQLRAALTVGQWQQLGNHWLFNGYPDSASFRQHLPESISLTVAFPSHIEWTKDQLIVPQSKSISIFFTPFPDLDLISLTTMVKNAVELCTEDGESIVFSFLPEPELLLLAESLGCRCFIAEPNLQQYQRILAAWKNHKGKI
ncbi:MAG: hypothetical protein RLZZ574_1766 [Cyanobacteriota bacterium]|jgi:CheY-like chemotaxis protein